MSRDFYKKVGATHELLNKKYGINPISIGNRNEKSANNIAKRLYKDKSLQIKKEFEKAMDKLLEEKKHKIDVIKYGINFNKGPEKKRNNQNKLSEIEEEYDRKISELKLEYEKKINEIKDAYNHLATKELRDISEERKGFTTERPFLYGDSAYDFFEISEQYIYSLNANDADKYLKELYRKTMDSYQNWLAKAEGDEDTIKEIKNRLTLACTYYEKICNKEARRQYKKKLDIEENKIEEKIIRSYCSKEDQYDPELIKTISDNNSVKLKAVIHKKATNPITLELPDRKKRDILLTKTGEISFITFPNNIDAYVSEYEVSRIVNGQERIDKIYANIDLTKLGLDKETGEPSDPEYYNCIVNELLSEVVIRGSKYNEGYIGGVERDENGIYKIGLVKDELYDSEKEELAAVILYKQQDRQNNDNEEKEEVER